MNHFLLTVTLFLSPLCFALDEALMQQHLTTGAPLLGTFAESDSDLASWMSKFPDDSPLESLNIPGTHDTLTWAVDGLLSSFVKTQDITFFEQLDSGVRFIDLRIGNDNGRLRMYHGSELLDQNVELEDIFWGMYRWLESHTTETVLVSVKVDNGLNTGGLQQMLRDLVTGVEESAYWVQSNRIPTLGEARGKAVLFRRVSFASITNDPPVGINLSKDFTDNSPAIILDYLGAGQKLVFVEDLYDVDKTDTTDAINVKFAALTNHITQAGTGSATDDFYISFASGFSTLVTPETLALGDGDDEPGVNSKTIDFLSDRQGTRVGVILYDFYGSDSRLGPVTIGNGDLVVIPTSGTRVAPVATTGAAARTSSTLFAIPCFIALTVALVL